MRVCKSIAGLALLAIGLLWSLQGADLVRIEPILCMANCAPIVGGSVAWLIGGLVTIAVGIGLLATLKRRSR